jgi:hypothetical protein
MWPLPQAATFSVSRCRELEIEGCQQNLEREKDLCSG